MTEHATDKAGLSDERQWELALASLQRANESTNYLRVLMFVAAGGLLVFALPELQSTLPRGVLHAHGGAIVLSLLSICILFYSWHIQRVKARERFTYLRDRNYEAYLQYDKAVETISSKRDGRLDALAFFALLVGFAIELYARYQTVAAAAPPPPVPGVHV
jgi:hypothetical protein